MRPRSVDLILTDLPYGVTQNKWDTVIPLDKLWRAYDRVLKADGVVVLTAQAPFSFVLGLSNPEWFRYEWIWKKNIASGHLDANRKPMRKHEQILVFSRGRPRYYPQVAPGSSYRVYRDSEDSGDNYQSTTPRITSERTGRLPTTVIDFDRPDDRKRIHPTQKPVSLFKYLIQTYTEEDQLVLDSCMGSGTTAIAALQAKRRFIGFEADETYCLKARQRIKEERNKPQWQALY